MPRRVSRRDFVHTATAATAFTIVPRHVLGRGFRAPSDTLNIACIGVGGMGKNDVKGVAGENLIALCDVDWKAADESFRTYPRARRYRDFREMLEREHKSIDAVTISTPDHTHAVAAMAALKLGKHVYCQKPLARTLHEVQTLMREAVARPRQVTQMGNQGHTFEGTRQIREWVEAGIIGPVREVHYWTNRPIWPQGIERPTEQHNPPPTLDWNLWLGPAAERPYHPAYAPFRWRGWWDFGTGALGDMACHGLDAAFWALDLGYPSRVVPESTKLFNETAPSASRVTFTFPAKGNRAEVALVWRDGSLAPPRPRDLAPELIWPVWDIGGQLWLGDKGTILAGMYGEDPRLLDATADAALRANMPAQSYPRSKGVYVEWVEACKGNGKALSTFDGHAGPLTTLVLLGCLAVRHGSALDVDPATGTLRTTVQDGWLRPEYRKGWSL